MPVKDIFHCVGVSYKKADAKLRGKFNLSSKTALKLLNEAKASGIKSIVVNSTCNRTEIYSEIENPSFLIDLFCMHTEGSFEEFERVGKVWSGDSAIKHLFKVGTGLDSQILGDFEIIAQLKKSFNFSKANSLLSPFMERMLNYVLQASKRIKNETNLSSGATSISYVSVRYILDNIENLTNKKILLFGLGKIGRNTCDNLVKHLKNVEITLINRTIEKAEKLASKHSIDVKDFSSLTSEIRTCDVLIVATGADKPTITKSLIHSEKPLLILDLSIPKNVNVNVEDLPNVNLIHLDELSKMANKTMESRIFEIPKAVKIINEIIYEFEKWILSRTYTPNILALKNYLLEIQKEELKQYVKKNPSLNSSHASAVSEKIIQKLTNKLALHFKESKNPSKSIKAFQTLFDFSLNE